MLQLIVRMTTMALLLICGALAHHVPQHAHHGHPTVAAGPQTATPPSGDACTAAAADQAHLAHPCTPVALLPQPQIDDVDLPLVPAPPPTDDALTAAAAAADAAHPPGRHHHTVLALTSVYRS
ncbi:hypothetical protein [Actinoplanes italicus]|jgi:hypothetical protein|uniref:Secreted protein n=1 Tax=Actinoplanes italicus TaxID=113567 RepID=A0A2T0JQ58_9ACTN|nr:hypothetical protein [Actinoplanes italicus]PRX09761.1 hypothetical protein CLV67_13537 [Actinoplanes italicus]